MVKLTRRRFLLTSLLSLASVTVGLGYVETRRLKISYLNLGLGSRLAFLTDPHIHEFGEVEERVLDAIGKIGADLIVLGGDFVDEFTHDMDVVVKYVRALEAREKLAVMGNHEYWSGKVGEVAGILKRYGFTLLYDSVSMSSIGKVYGLDWRDGRKYPKLKAEGIVVVHDPNAVASISGRCLILAGHTHGGITVAGMTLYSNSIFTRGLYNLEGGSTLYVSRGLGQMLPLRPTSPLELVVID